MLALAPLTLLFACNNGPMDAEDVRAELDNPTARLDASTLPDVTDDFFLNDEAFDRETNAFSFLGSAESGARLGPEGMAERVRGFANASDLQDIAAPALGDVFCATDFLLQLSSFEDCDRGNTCEVELVLKACLLRIGEDGDDSAKGKIRFTLREEERSDFDRGTLELGFEKWRYTEASGAWTQLDGLLAIEGTSWHDGSREELVYSADFSTRGFDPEARGVFRSGETYERIVRAAMRFVYEEVGSTETGSVEMLAWVDEDGDGREDATAVIRFSVEVSPLGATDEDGTLTGFTAEVIDASGTWTCTWNVAEQVSDTDGTTWTSAGTCTDPDGETVNFDGTVFDEN